MSYVQMEMLLDEKPEDRPLQIPDILRLSQMTPYAFGGNPKTPVGAIRKKGLSNGLKNSRGDGERAVGNVKEINQAGQRVEESFKEREIGERRPGLTTFGSTHGFETTYSATQFFRKRITTREGKKDSDLGAELEISCKLIGFVAASGSA